MIDITGTAMASALLSTDTVLTSMGVVTVNAAEKSSWNTMIEIVWALLEPKIQILFPTRQEMATYTYTELNKAFMKHHETPQHSQGYGIGSATIPGFTILEPGDGPIEIPLQTILSKVGRPTPMITPVSSVTGEDSLDFEMGAPQMEPITVYSMSPAIGIIEA